MFSLEGKRALVSGAGAPNGIGFAIAKTLRAQGAEVIITSTTNRIFERASEIDAVGFVADLTQVEDCKQLVAELSGLDILVNNAGMTSLTAPLGAEETTDLTQLSLAAWRNGLNRNLDTAFNLTKEALPLLRRSSNGRIIMISSVTGPLMAMRNQPGYAAAKAALVGLTRSLALDEAKYQITCNAILPGWIETDTQNAHESAQGKSTPLGRSGTPNEIASLVAWLASAGSSYMTGQALVVDGGNSISEERN